MRSLQMLFRRSSQQCTQNENMYGDSVLRNVFGIKTHSTNINNLKDEWNIYYTCLNGYLTYLKKNTN